MALDAAQLASLAGMSDEDATSALGKYMQDFTREIELDLDGWNSLSDADQSLLLTADRLSELEMTDLGGKRVRTGIDENGNATYDTLFLNDLLSGGKASLVNDPAAAMAILEAARKGVTAERAGIGSTQAMNRHMMNSLDAAHENLMRMESFLRDTDYAEATAELARTNVLQQTGMALLRTVQQQQSSILDLFA